MQTRKLALLSTMLIGLGGAALAQQATDPSADQVLPNDQTEAMQQEPAAEAGASDAGTTGGLAGEARDDMAPGQGIAEEMDDTAPDQGIAGATGEPRRSVTTSAEPYNETVLGGLSAEDVIGMTVVDASGEDVGEVNDLLITNDNTVDQAIIDVGGFLGFGAKPVAIEMDRLTVAEGDGEVVLDATREELDAMPAWQPSEDGWFTE
jgi:sporulation protein YlmC with PRC-barrel domain